MKVCLHVCVLMCLCEHVSFTTMYMYVCVRAWILMGHLCKRLKDKMHFMCMCMCVCVCVRVRATEESFSKSRLAALVFTMSLQLQRPFNLKTSQFESPSNIWPVFLLWLNDWMHPHRFLLTSSPIWNLVPVRSAQIAHTRTHVQTQHTRRHTQTHTSKAEITKAFVCAL